MKTIFILQILCLNYVKHGLASDKVTEIVRYTEKGVKVSIKQSSFKKMANRNFKESQTGIITLQEINHGATLANCGVACQDHGHCLGFLANRTQPNLSCRLVDHAVNISHMEDYDGIDYYEIKVLI